MFLQVNMGMTDDSTRVNTRAFFIPEGSYSEKTRSLITG